MGPGAVCKRGARPIPIPMSWGTIKRCYEEVEEGERKEGKKSMEREKNKEEVEYGERWPLVSVYDEPVIR